jgi:hypothetical protein
MRISTSLVAAGAVAVMGAAVLLPGAQAAPAPLHHRTLIPARKGQILPTRAATVTSLNWAGYAVTSPAGKPITAVATSFTVPALSPAGVGLAATWTGIGGYTTQDLIQAGVGEQNPAGLAGPGTDYAWYEILPAAQTVVTGCSGDAGCTVSPGDRVSVAIHQRSVGQWEIDIADGGRWTYTKDLAYASTDSSAEWILEAPSADGAQTVLPLMNDTPLRNGRHLHPGGRQRPDHRLGQPGDRPAGRGGPVGGGTAVSVVRGGHVHGVRLLVGLSQLAAAWVVEAASAVAGR